MSPILDIEEDGKDYYFTKGVQLMQDAKGQEAIEMFQNSLKMNPAHIPTYKNLSLCYISINKFEEAIKWIEQALTYDKKDAWLWYTKGYALKKMQKYGDAIQMLNASIELDPNDCDTHTLKGNAHREILQHETALSCYDTALTIDPFYDLARDNKISLLHKLVKFDEEETVKVEGAERYYNKAIKYQQQGMLITAIIFYFKANKYRENFKSTKENIETIIKYINNTPNLLSAHKLILYNQNLWKGEGILIYEMIDEHASIWDIMLDLIKVYDIPRKNLRFIIYSDSALILIEYMPKGFEQFFKQFDLPFHDIDHRDRLVARNLSDGESFRKMVHLVKDLKIIPYEFPNWTNKGLSFYNLGSFRNMSIVAVKERIAELMNCIYATPETIRIILHNGNNIAVHEEVPGAFNKFFNETKLQFMSLIRREQEES